MEPLELSLQHRQMLKEIALYIYPEFRYVIVGGDQISMTKSNPKYHHLDINWKRVHWLEFIIRSLPRLESIGRYGKFWIEEITMKVMTAFNPKPWLRQPEPPHPIVIIYNEYLKLKLPKEPQSQLSI
jgi:hypothetical protein